MLLLLHTIRQSFSLTQCSYLFPFFCVFIPCIRCNFEWHSLSLHFSVDIHNRGPFHRFSCTYLDYGIFDFHHLSFSVHSEVLSYYHNGPIHWTATVHFPDNLIPTDVCSRLWQSKTIEMLNIQSIYYQLATTFIIKSIPCIFWLNVTSNCSIFDRLTIKRMWNIKRNIFSMHFFRVVLFYCKFEWTFRTVLLLFVPVSAENDAPCRLQMVNSSDLDVLYFYRFILFEILSRFILLEQMSAYGVVLLDAKWF